MSSELVLLGTAGGPTLKRSRSAPAQAVVEGDRTYLVDAGNGVARQLERTNAVRLREHLEASHTDVERVSAIAEEAGARQLVLSHFVPGDDSVPDEEWLRLARRGYSGPVVAGRDLQRI